MTLAIRRRNCLSPVEAEFDRILNNFLTPLYVENTASLFKPPVELRENHNEFTVKVQIPGLNKEDIDIQVSESSVTIIGEHKESKEENSESIYRSEFRYGKFSRSIDMPDKIDHKNAKAQYDKGILTLTLPKSKEEKDKTIKLKL